jgi:L-ascorbate metabolism protein UlaG (beta-lactamase superfamily)
MTSQLGRSTTSAADGSSATDDVLFIGNATLLIRYHGLTILTDPNFIHAGEEIPLGYGLTTTRLTDPAMEIDDLPPLDLVLLSHFHADHFDRLAEERLDRAVPILTTPDAAEQLDDRGFRRPVPLETWESYRKSGPEGHVKVTALPGKHAPAMLAVALPEVMGSYVEFWHSASDGAAGAGGPTGEPSLRLYISGDTIVYEGLREIPQRCPQIDVALLHLGGTRVMGVTVTMDAEQGVEALRLIKPKVAVPIHYDDYEAFKSPLDEFVSAVREAGLEDRVRYVNRGETLALKPTAASTMRDTNLG